MDANKSYVTQITKNDLKEMADAANTHAGEGIVVTPTKDGLEISIDRQYLKMCIKACIAGNEF